MEENNKPTVTSEQPQIDNAEAASILDSILSNAQEDAKNIHTIKDEVEQFKSATLIDSEGRQSTKTVVNNLVEDIQKRSNEIREIHDAVNSLQKELMGNDEGVESVKDKIAKIQELFSKNLEENKAQLKDLNSIHELVFGNDEKQLIGTKQRLEGYEKEIIEKQNLWQNNFQALYEKIEGLLPGATSTGLAQAYQDQRKSYNFPYWLWSSVFVLTMGGMIWFAVDTLSTSKDVNEALMKMFSRIPFFIPAFWLAIFSSKQQSQNKRLQQEYAYKETLTKSYEADKREIEKLPESEEKTKLSAKLLDIMIEMAKNNPSETLRSKDHNDSPPSLLDIFKMKAVKKITGN